MVKYQFLAYAVRLYLILPVRNCKKNIVFIKFNNTDMSQHFILIHVFLHSSYSDALFVLTLKDK